MPEVHLDSWQSWSVELAEKPRLVEQLRGGKTNCSYLLAGGGKKMVLRVNAGNSRQLGIDRRREKVILEAVSGAGLAPDIYHCDPERGVLVTEFIDGKPLDISRPESLTRLQSLLDRVHSLKPEIPVFDYLAHAENYWQQLADKSGQDPHLYKREGLLEQLRKLQAVSGEGLSHHDPVPENIIDRDGELFLLDWEYAGLGSPEFDRAVIRAEWPGFCVMPVRDEIQRAADHVYRGFCHLWQSVGYL